MIKQMSKQISRLLVKPTRNMRIFCGNCRTQGHKREKCVRLKQYFKCKQTGRIAKFCKSASQPGSDAAEHD